MSVAEFGEVTYVDVPDALVDVIRAWTIAQSVIFKISTHSNEWL